MRILYIFGRYYPERYGGAEISNRAMVKEMAKNNDVWVATLSDRIPTSDREYDGVQINYVKKPLPDMSFNIFPYSISSTNVPLIPNFVKYLFDVKFSSKMFEKVVKRVNPDIIHASGVNPLIMAYDLSKKCGIPYVIHLRGYRVKCVIALTRTNICEKCDFHCLPFPMKSVVRNVYQNPLRKALEKSSRIITISKWMKEVFKNEGYTNIEVIYNPILVEKEPLFDFSEKENQFLFCGRLVSRKGINELVKGFQIFYRNNNEYTLKIAGKGEFPYNVEGVDFLGFLSYDEMLEEMKRSKFCVFPSKYPEPFGRVVVEAQSVGSLVLGSGSGGMKELLKYGITVEVKPEKIAEKLEEVIKIEPEKYMDLVKNAYRFVKKNCSPLAMRKKLQPIYEEVVG